SLSSFSPSSRRHTRSKRDWSSDVCASDLVHAHLAGPHRHPCPSWIIEVAAVHSPTTSSYHHLLVLLRSERPRVAGRRVWRLTGQIGRASRRERAGYGDARGEVK